MTTYFETRTRADGERFTCLTDDAPEWVRDAVRDAHDGELPNDWRYTIIADLFTQLLIDPTDGYVTAGLVDTYNYDRAMWLAGDLSRDGYCQQALEESTATGAFDLIGQAQELCIEMMAAVVRDAIAEHADDDESAD